MTLMLIFVSIEHVELAYVQQLPFICLPDNNFIAYSRF